MKKIIFFVGSLSQPRCIKRIEAIHKSGFKVKVYGYNRGEYDYNTYSDNISVDVLGLLENGKGYLKKMSIIRSDINRIVSRYDDVNTCFYAFGFFQALCLCLKGTKYVYEISDLLYAYPQYRLILPLCKKLDKYIIKRSIGCVLTSMGFATFLDLDISDKSIIIIPNKVSQVFENYNRKPLSVENNFFSFGFVGAVRYNTIHHFAKIIGKFYPNHKFHFFGGASKETKEKCLALSEQYSNVYYHGPFKNPDSLSDIYSQIDVVVACYETHSLNERLAEPNKLYEALLFCKPIIVSKGTFLSEQVAKYQCGFCMDASNEEAIKSLVNSLTPESINSISTRELSYDKSVYIDNTSKLIQLLKQ